MERKRQREIGLAIVAVAALAIAGYSIKSSTSRTAAGGNAAPGTAVSSAPSAQAGKGSQTTFVNLEALQTVRPEPIDGERNPFRFKPKPAPPTPAVVQSQQAMVQQLAQNGPAAPPPIGLKFISRWESPNTGAIAVLSDGKGLVVQGREGETIEGRYRILRIGVESVELAYLDGRGRQTIRLGQ